MTQESFLSGPCDILVLRKWNAVGLLKHLCGPLTQKALASHPNSLRALYGGPGKEDDAVFCPTDVYLTREAISTWFPDMPLDGLDMPNSLEAHHQDEASKRSKAKKTSKVVPKKRH